MDDKFLFDYRPSLRPEFTKNLYETISPKRNWNFINKEQIRQPKVWIGLILLAVVFVGCVQKIIGTNFQSVNFDGVVTLYEVNYALEQPPEDWVYESFYRENTPQIMTEKLMEKYNLIPLSAALDLLPYTVKMPTNLPKGYTLQSKYISTGISSTFQNDCIGLFWMKEVNNFNGINLWVCPERQFGQTVNFEPAMNAAHNILSE